MELKSQPSKRQGCGSVDLRTTIFGLEPRADILTAWSMAAQQAPGRHAQGQGAAAKITRTGKKLGNQKGRVAPVTARARVPQFRRRRQGLWPASSAATPSTCQEGPRTRLCKHALSAKAKAGELIVLDSGELKAAKTKAVMGHLLGHSAWPTR